MSKHLLNLKRLILVAAIGLGSLGAQGGTLSISNVPLGTGSGISAKPNLVFILDDSGSMSSDYTPDWVNDSVCQSNMASFGSTYNCSLGDVLFNWSRFNSQYYDPAIRYSPPKNADGSEWANANTSQTASKTRTDPFLTTSTKDIIATYREVYWCQSDSDSPPSANCRTNSASELSAAGSGYPYPNGTYRYRKTLDNSPPYYFVASSGDLSWCSNKALTTCQNTRTSTYQYPKTNGTAAAAAVSATASLTYTQAGGGSGCTSSSGPYRVSSIVVNGTELLAGTVTIYGCDSAANRSKLAADVATSISSGTATHGISASAAGNSVILTAPGTPSYSFWTGKTITHTDNSSRVDVTVSNFAGGKEAVSASGGIVLQRIDITSATASYTKGTDRLDCTGSACTYQEELQNFANWYSYYRTRMHMMKTSISRSFATISDTAPGSGFRIGLMMISSGADSGTVAGYGDTTCWTDNRTHEVNIGNFDPSQKTSFYTNLFAVKTCSYTPLRGALSRAGRMFAGQDINNGTSIFSDPVQLSCQQNFAFLSTDGYWNNNIESSSFGPKQINNSTDVGNQDGTTSTNFDSKAVIAPNLDALNASNTLADVASYYYNTDLRTSMTNDVPKSPTDLAEHQHMVTFTMGLGVDGALDYSPDYLTGGSADFNAILQGTKNWGNPITNSTDARIDDLWHAAVNGRGQYFSAKNPTSVAKSLNDALKGVAAATGAGASAATSNLEPVAGDNFAYVASFVTQRWEGNLDAKRIDLVTGTLSDVSDWSAQSTLDSQALVSPVPSGASGPGSRKLYSYDPSISGTDKKFLLTWTNAQAKGWDGSVTGKDYFNPNQLPQCNPLSFCPGASQQNMFEYLMGGADTTTNKSYRERLHVLGDIINSQPLFVKSPSFNYLDTGYDTFKTVSRKAMVYVSGNDGFLHAFDATTGNEDWAYLPTPVLPNLYELATTNYAHRYYVDGSVVGGDVAVGSAWKTILVGGYGGGGKGYYAIDITDPTAPLALWEFSDARMGLSYGNPIITKLPAGSTSSGGADIAGKWVVLLTSGYNNATNLGSHDGQGILYVLDAYTGTEYFRIYGCADQTSDGSCAGSSGSPSGLAKINNWVEDSLKNNTALYVYGGDLEGNLWRFDLANKTAFAVANVAEPITVKPELAEISGERVVLFGTGLFLQSTDRSDGTKRSIYGIRDNPAATSTLTNVKTSGSLLRQTLVANGSSRTISGSSTAVNWTLDYGWFIELLDTGERINVDPKLQLGTLIIASNVPDNTSANSCTTGGYSWLNYLDISTGGSVDNAQSNPDDLVSAKIGNALTVGVNAVKLPNGKLISITTTSDNKHPVSETPIGTANLPLKRISWRELTTD
jgi:type IV pilus assembly protein PilY1